VSVAVLIPAFNEEHAVHETVTRVRNALLTAAIEHEIVVIDDGSTDGTATEAARSGATVLKHPVNGGYGRALKTGLRHASAQLIAITDADGSYPSEELPRLIAEMDRFDMVVGARQGLHYRGSRAKWFGRRALERMVQFVTGVRVPDVNSGLRVFRRQIALDNINQIGNGFSFTTTLTLAVLLEGHFVRYVPVPYGARVGSSKVRIRRDILRTTQILVMAILAYNPIKLFLLLTYLALLVLVPALALDFVAAGGTHAGVILVVDLMGALVIFGLGLMTDVLRRQL